jgi:hypothetical protein
MVPSVRKQFNGSFDQAAYRAFISDLDSFHPGAIDFRVAETPVFIPRGVGDMITGTCEHIIDRILEPGFRELTERAIPQSDRVPNENGHPHMISFDFGICIGENGLPEPKLIEMQAFPTLYGFQVLHPEAIERHFHIPDGYSHFFNGYDRNSYISALRDVIIGDCNPENVILLEIRPHEQKTRIDFYCTKEYLGIEIVCLTQLKSEGTKLFYEKDGRRIRVDRIYNRVIFDELHAQRDTLGEIPDITRPWDVEWIPHPNWFYRISKFTLPYIRHPHVPETFFLDALKELPDDLENFVLKPLFSFAGQGVVIDVTKADIDAVKEPAHWILQRKVRYADIIETPDIPAKAEIRMMYIWKDGAARPILATNLARLSKGKMIGVRYNKDKEWVGASVAYFEK